MPVLLWSNGMENDKVKRTTKLTLIIRKTKRGEAKKNFSIIQEILMKESFDKQKVIL